MKIAFSVLSSNGSIIFFLRLESTLWVVGGYDNHTGTETTEFLSFDQPSSHGVKLPFTIADHCMVSIPNGKVVILGQGRRNINTIYACTALRFCEPNFWPKSLKIC